MWRVVGMSESKSKRCGAACSGSDGRCHPSGSSGSGGAIGSHGLRARRTSLRAVRRSAALVIAIASLAPSTSAMAQAGARTLVVDADRAQCPTAQFQSIQAAVAAATPGDTVEVCPDLYTGPVVVEKPRLALRARGRGAGDCFDPTPAPADPARDVIVSSVEQGLYLRASGVVAEGFVLQNSNVGIKSDERFSGYVIRHNLAQSNLFGAQIGNSGDTLASVANNCFRRNGAGQAGGGMFSTPGFGATLTNGDISRNSFFRNNFGIRLGRGSLIAVHHNHSLDDGVFMRVGGTSDFSVHHNLVRGGSGGGVVFIPFGLVEGVATNAQVAYNDIKERGGSGIQAEPNSVVDSTFSHNRVTANGTDGINLRAGNTGNRIERNVASGNGSDGIHAQGATGNVFQWNVMWRNAEHDAHDDARATNTWTANLCDTDLPTGAICRRPGSETTR